MSIIKIIIQYNITSVISHSYWASIVGLPAFDAIPVGPYINNITNSITIRYLLFCTNYVFIVLLVLFKFIVYYLLIEVLFIKRIKLKIFIKLI